jgi:hypothetical protein
MMATSQGLPSRDLVVSSGEVPESLAHLFDDQHTPQRKLVDGAHGAVGTSAQKEGTEVSQTRATRIGKLCA